MQFKYFSINEIRNFIKNNNLAINKKIGQNFLINSGAVDAIISGAQIKKTDLVLEIGCGLGSLTHKILEIGCGFLGFEIDRAYIKLLKEQFGHFSHFRLIEGDFLTEVIKNQELIRPSTDQQVIFIGNLPYHITTPIMEKIFLTPLYFDKLIFMVQKEVAERIIAKENTAQYGSLSIFTQYFSDPRVIVKLSSRSFYPAPSVESRVVLFERKNTIKPAENTTFFFKVVRSLFMNRRKQLKNTLLSSPLLNFISPESINEALRKTDISPTVRGETLSLQKIIELANELYRLKGRS